LLDRKDEIFIASNGAALALLNDEFPGLKKFELPGYDPVYPVSGSMIKKMALQLPKFMKAIEGEHAALEEIISQHNIDVVISDNRYGCYSEKVKSIIITHQVNILMPAGLKWLQKDVNKYNAGLLNRFAETWVPVARVSPIPALTEAHSDIKLRHIGYLSRFSKINSNIKYKFMAICTGPEPQRSLLEEILREQLKSIDYPVLMVRGLADKQKTKAIKQGKFTIVDFLNSDLMNEAIESSELIISRSGYSTVMDLARLNKKAIFIPTPGQTEQEYIAEQLLAEGIAYCCKQSKFHLQEALKKTEKFTGFIEEASDEKQLEMAIKSI
jgi:uncharacterized protein (TIGR00661 family)